MNLTAGNQPLILNDLPAIHWGLAGAGIAIITLLLLWTTNKRLGISTSYESVCAIASDLPYFRRASLKGPGRWRLYFLGGLLMGGALSAIMGGGWAPTWELGLWDERVGPVLGATPMVKSLWMFGGGLLIGLGTRISNGCTSGHGIFGLSNLEKGSLKAVLAFLATGIITANLIYGVLF